MRRRVSRPQQPGAPSDEVAGTGKRTGTEYNLFNDAEMAPGRLRTTIDPVSGQIKQAEYIADRSVVGPQGVVQESERSFKPDAATHGFQSRTDAYTNSGYDRGHLGPREAFRGSALAEGDADLLTNVVPMSPELNQRGAWRAAELRTNRLAMEHGRVKVVSNPIYDANPPRLRDGTPVPREIRRQVFTEDGRLLEADTYLNPYQTATPTPSAQ